MLCSLHHRPRNHSPGRTAGGRRAGRSRARASPRPRPAPARRCGHAHQPSRPRRLKCLPLRPHWRLCGHWGQGRTWAQRPGQRRGRRASTASPSAAWRARWRRPTVGCGRSQSPACAALQKVCRGVGDLLSRDRCRRRRASARSHGAPRQGLLGEQVRSPHRSVPQAKDEEMRPRVGARGPALTSRDAPATPPQAAAADGPLAACGTPHVHPRTRTRAAQPLQGTGYLIASWAQKRRSKHQNANARATGERSR